MFQLPRPEAGVSPAVRASSWRVERVASDYSGNSSTKSSSTIGHPASRISPSSFGFNFLVRFYYPRNVYKGLYLLLTVFKNKPYPRTCVFVVAAKEIFKVTAGFFETC